LPSQQPLGQDVALQTHWPPEQTWPVSEQGPVLQLPPQPLGAPQTLPVQSGVQALHV
jgi:hypothetical protein